MIIRLTANGKGFLPSFEFIVFQFIIITVVVVVIIIIISFKLADTILPEHGGLWFFALPLSPAR